MTRTPTDLSTLDASGVKLIAADMDGTLLNDAKELPDGLWDLIQALRDKGVTFVPASGRQYWTLRRLFSPVAEGMTIIGENGALVMRDNDELFRDGMDCETAIEVVKRVRKEVRAGVDTGIVVCCAKSAYIERADQGFQDTVREYYNHTEVVPDLVEHVERMLSGQVEDHLLKLAQWASDGIVDITLRTMEPFMESHQRVVSGANWTDLQSRSVNKGHAIAALQDSLGIGPAQTMVFGDFNNDIEMLLKADFSFAMLNAADDVHDVSHFVAPSNNDAGVVQVVRRLFGV